MSTASKKYYDGLEQFISLCHQLLNRNHHHLVVIICHELYRFLYAVEPYANFKHSAPVTFMAEHVYKLIELGKSYGSTVIPYSFEVEKFRAANTNKVEKKTSDMYSDFWKSFDTKTLTEESEKLLRNRLPAKVIDNCIIGKTVLDMGCGSGRYSIALAKFGAREVMAVDLQKKSFASAEQFAAESGLAIRFYEGHLHRLPFENARFDFILCNGVLHHTTSIRKGLAELERVLQPAGEAFIYLYGSGGIFWRTRKALRAIFYRIPMGYAEKVLDAIGMPSNRFIFCDTWYVPIETHTTVKTLHQMFEERGFGYKKIIGQNSFDLDLALVSGIPGAEEMWGNGEHRYVISKECHRES